MVGFNPSTGGIDLISQPGDISLDGSPGPACNHECPKCCPPEVEELSKPLSRTEKICWLLLVGVVVGGLFFVLLDTANAGY
jgi:hypothetical protein